jgi:hypothetical protein
MSAGLRWVLLATGLGVALSLPGCGGGGGNKLRVKGRLLDNGQPLKVPTEGIPPGDRGIRVTFYPMFEGEETPDPEVAVVNPDGATFEVPGKDGKGITPGKYRISIQLGARGRPDLLNDAFGPDTSPIIREVTGEDDMVVDIKKPAG